MIDTSADQRLFFTTDIKGADRAFRKVLNAGSAYDADIIVVSGNLAGTALVPIVKRSVSGWFTSKAGKTITLDTDAELAAFVAKSADGGIYAVEIDADILHARSRAERDPYLEEVFEREATTRLTRWLDLIADRGLTNIYLSCGSDDPEHFPELISAATAVTATDGRGIEIAADRYLITTSYSNPTPWETLREVPEADLAQHLDDLLALVPDSATQLVFNMHAPPFDSELDSSPRLGPNLEPITIAGQELREPVGSSAVRSAIERYHPAVSLHGRVLDSRGETHIGSTVSINPGSESADGTLLGALIDFDRRGVRSHLLTIG